MPLDADGVLMPEIVTKGEPLSESEAAAKILEMMNAKPADSDSDESQQDGDSSKEEDTSEEDSTDTEQPDEDSVDEGEEEQESDDDQPEPKESQTFEVKVRGKVERVTMDELLKGYSRTADYSRSKNETAAVAKAAEEAKSAAEAERTRYAEGVNQVAAYLKAATPPEPDWKALQEKDPAEFATTWAAWKYRQDQIAAVEAEKASLAAQESKSAEEKRLARRAKAAEELREKMPEWKDPEKAKQEWASIRSYASDVGFTDQDLNDVDDPRVVQILRDAARFRQAQKAAAAPKGKAPLGKKKSSPTLTPGAAPEAGDRQTDAVKKAKQRFAKTGRAGDAAALLLQSGYFD